MEKKASPLKKQKVHSEEPQEKMPSLVRISIQALCKAKPKSILTQFEAERNPIPEELKRPLFNQALISKQNKQTLITLFEVLPLDDYADIAVNIAYSRESIYLSPEDRLHILYLLEEIDEPACETKKILNILRNALFEQCGKVESIQSPIGLFCHSLNNKEAPSKMIELFLKNGLLGNTVEIVGSFVKTFRDINRQDLREQALKKLSLLVDAQLPLNNKVFESTKIRWDNRDEIRTFNNPHDYLQHIIADISKQELQGASFGNATEQTKVFYMQAIDLLKARS